MIIAPIGLKLNVIVTRIMLRYSLEESNDFDLK